MGPVSKRFCQLWTLLRSGSGRGEEPNCGRGVALRVLQEEERVSLPLRHTKCQSRMQRGTRYGNGCPLKALACSLPAFQGRHQQPCVAPAIIQQCPSQDQRAGIGWCPLRPPAR